MTLNYTLSRQDFRRGTLFLMSRRHGSVLETLALFAVCLVLAASLVNIIAPVYVGYPLLISFVLAVLMYPSLLHLCNLLFTEWIVWATFGGAEFRPQQITLSAEGVRETLPRRERVTRWEQIVWTETNGRDVYFHKVRGALFVPATAFVGHAQVTAFLEAASAYKQRANTPEVVWPPPPTSGLPRMGG